MSWLLTFVVHSSVWCGAAWLGLRVFNKKASVRAREAVWYTAIAASLITPTVQVFRSNPDASVRLLAPSVLFAAKEQHHDGEERHELAPRTEHTSEQSLSPFARWSWLSIAGALALLQLARRIALERRLRHRAIVRDARPRQLLANLTRAANLTSTPKLTECEDLGSPIAMGIGPRREICIPTRALCELDDDHLRALLGHEVAHHLRRDTVRLLALNALKTVFFFQPLFLVAIREIRFATEQQCDDWAAQQVGDRIVMAGCLTEVAGWLLPGDRRMPVPCMGAKRSQLAVRVDRLIEDEPDDQRGARKRAPRIICGATTIALVSWIAPGVGPAIERHEHAERNRTTEHRHEREHPSGEHREH